MNGIPRLFLIITVLAGISSPAQESNQQAAEPADHHRALENPQMGWTMHFYSNIITNYGSKLKPSDALDDFPGPGEPGRHFPITDYALSKGVTLRDDSFCVQAPPKSWFHAEMAQEFWPKLPVVLEHEHYGPSKQKKAWRDGTPVIALPHENDDSRRRYKIGTIRLL